MQTNELLTHVLNIGELMLVSGAEINRVEDSISRMCKAYRAKRVDVFTITSSILLTVHLEDGTVFTQSRRILNYATNLNKLDKLNNLSRYICQQTPDFSYIIAELARINADGSYSKGIQYLGYALTAGAFTIFFGGGMADAIVSAGIGIILKALVVFVQKAERNAVLVNLLCSFTVGILAVLAVSLGIGNKLEEIIIGNIMLMIPGVALTNSIRDMISGDTMSGLLRLSEAVFIALAIAVGFGAASFLLGGVLK